jgi:putative tryptophan/tyrosine transport system substrate-binding protein
MKKNYFAAVKHINLLPVLLFISFLLAGLVFFISLFSIRQAMATEVKEILLIESMPVPAVLESTRWFKEGLKGLGYIEGQNVKLHIINLNGEKEGTEAKVRILLQQVQPDLVVTNATLASKIAYKILQDSNTPMLFFTVGAPVKAGLVQAVGVPSGNNITGKVKMLPSRIRQTIVSRLLTGFSPQKAIRIGYIYPSYPASIGDLQYLREDSSILEFVPFKIDYRAVPEGIPQMLEDTIKGIKALEDQVDFWWESAGPLGELEEYTETLLKHSKRPIIFGHRMDSVKAGAIVSLVVSLEANGRETAQLADAILRGQNPGEIPVIPVTSFLLGINLQTAINAHIVVPKDILELAKDNIYY